MTTPLFELVEYVRDLRSMTKMAKRMNQRRLACTKSKRILNKYHRFQYKKTKYELKIRNILKRYNHIIDECLSSQTICRWLDCDLFLNNKRKKLE